MLIDIDKIEVGDRIRNDTGNLQELADNIKENGLISPITVNKDHVLLAGERRLRACMLLGWKQIPANVMDTRDAEHELNIEISENECRKEFTKSERAEYIRRRFRIEQAKAKGRMSDGGKGVVNNAPLQRADEATAKTFGMSATTMHRELYIDDHRDEIDPAEYTDWNEGRTSTNKVYTRLKASEEQETPKVRTCRKCGVELTDENTFAGNECKDCRRIRNTKTQAKYRHPTIENEQPEWSIKTLISELAANAPTWRNTAMHTFAVHAEYGVKASKKSIDAISRVFDELDTAIAEIVEG